jgi:Ca2+-transporting ATPase
MIDPNNEITGLTDSQIQESRRKYGSNTLTFKNESAGLHAVLELLKEPMVLLLILAASLYLIIGQYGDGIFLLSAVLLLSSISLFQNYRSNRALEKLKNFTEEKSAVIRNGLNTEINTDDIVVGDYLILEEGKSVNADGIIVQSNDFSVDESSLTGESLAISKSHISGGNDVFRGTVVMSGRAIIEVSAVGNNTRWGKIGKSLEGIMGEKTPLQIQIDNFVKMMAGIGILVFLAVWLINYLRLDDLLQSLLYALTLAMSILPEEIPVAFAAFTAIGAWRLMQKGVVIKHVNTVETLGSATVICTDKTGTLTENRMKLSKVFVPGVRGIHNMDEPCSDDEAELIRIAMFASEPVPFDTLEIEIHDIYKKLSNGGAHDFRMIHEYPLGGHPPMMTHIFENPAGDLIIAAKGAPEAILAVSDIDNDLRKVISETIKKLSADGLRILAVGQTSWPNKDWPDKQQQFKFSFKGLIAFYDPPKQNIKEVLSKFYTAGIKVKIITGDNGDTAMAIARQIGFKGADKCISGQELMSLDDSSFKEAIKEYNIFSRMFPEAKLKIIEGLKSVGEIVAMTGDGVNDGPALKASHIGIAMGRKGTEIAKQASALILVEDDLSMMVEAVEMGRRIYANLKKAIQYIISIHIPIILIVVVPLTLGWIYPNLFSPVHIIFLELIMGPTCSVIYENEPAERNAMMQAPRPFSSTFFNLKEISISILQGLVISLALLSLYQYSVHNAYNEDTTRAMVFTALTSSNIMLTLVNRSFYYSVFAMMRNRNYLIPAIILLTALLLGCMLVFEPLRNFFGFSQLNSKQLFISVCLGIVSVIWIELLKWRKRSVTAGRTR